METHCSTLFLAIFILLGFLAAISQAETHFHEFVVCIYVVFLFTVCFCTIFCVMNYFFYVTEIDSSRASEEAVQNT